MTVSLIDENGKPYEVSDGLLNAMGFLFVDSCKQIKNCSRNDEQKIADIIRKCVMDGLNLRNGNAIG